MQTGNCVGNCDNS